MSVYFIQAGGPSGPIKIGYTTGNPHRRMRKLQTGNPEELHLLVSIPGERAHEQELLDRFKALSMRGEWLRADPRLLGFVEALLRAYPEQPLPPPEEEEVAGLDLEQRRFTEGRIRWVILRTEIDRFLQALDLYDLEAIDPDAIGFEIPVTFRDGDGETLRALQGRLTTHCGEARHARGALVHGLLGEQDEVSRYRDILEAVANSPYVVPGVPWDLQRGRL